MEWTRETCLELIDMYEKHPVLWNPHHYTYYNKVKKREAWDKLSEKIGCTSFEAKKKMDSILSSFRREKARERQRVRAGRGKHVSQWFAFKRMAFLAIRNKPEPVESSVETVQENDHHIKMEEIVVEPVTLQEGDIQDSNNTEGLDGNQESHVLSASMSPRPLNRVIRRKRPQHSSQIDKALEILTAVASKSVLEGVPDQCSDYGKHVGNKLRNCSDRARAIAQYHINNILFEADMGRFDTDMEPSTTNMIHPIPSPKCFESHATYTKSTPTPSPLGETQSIASPSYSNAPSPNLFL